MTVQEIIFWLLALAVLGSALFVVTTRNLFHAALMLILSFFGVAGFYVLLEVGFFAVAQVLVYIGAISILFIFAVMLTRGMMGMERTNSQASSAAMAVLALGIAMFLVLRQEAFVFSPSSIPVLGQLFFPGNSDRLVGGIPWTLTTQPVIEDSYIPQFGVSLVDVGQYLLPFLLSAVLLDIALAGAIHVARERRPAEVAAERAEMAAEAADEQQREAALQPDASPVPETALAADQH
jgi:NADH:ubiquinone oxidoreductase subunit 6 (subunit J)